MRVCEDTGGHNHRCVLHERLTSLVQRWKDWDEDAREQALTDEDLEEVIRAFENAIGNHSIT